MSSVGCSVLERKLDFRIILWSIAHLVQVPEVSTEAEVDQRASRVEEDVDDQLSMAVPPYCDLDPDIDNVNWTQGTVTWLLIGNGWKWVWFWQ